MTSTRHETSFEDNIITRSRPQNILNITQNTLKSTPRLDMIPMTSPRLGKVFEMYSSP